MAKSKYLATSPLLSVFVFLKSLFIKLVLANQIESPHRHGYQNGIQCQGGFCFVF